MRDSIFMTLFVFLGVALGISSIYAFQLFSPLVMIDVVEGSFISYDGLGRVACVSDSMGLTLGCDDKLLFEKVTNDSHMDLGKIYVYNATNHTVVHRLVGCNDVNCSVLVFKGDNNQIMDEYIPKEKVLYKVIGVLYS